MDIIEIISRETIKPSSPTLPHNRIHNLSWFDQVSSRFFIPLLLFYRHGFPNASETSSLLKNSLSQTLSKYYPFAGRIQDRKSVLCNDEGVDFIEVKVRHMKLSSLFQNPKMEILHLLFPDNLQWSYTDLNTLLAIQVNYFDCGGLAISVCMSHKLSDAATIISFVNYWASTARNAGQEVSFPDLNAASLFPCVEQLPLLPEFVGKKETNYASRRFVFEAEKIDSLKSIISGKVQNPTRVEAVTSLLYKSAINASKEVSGSTTRSHLLVQHVNMRTRMVPKLPEASVGSLSWFFPVSTPEEIGTDDDDDKFFGGFVSQMREEFTKICTSFAERLRGEDWFLVILEIIKEYKKLTNKSDQQVCRFSSWCRFSSYEVDFGWGKPLWVTSVGSPDKNSFILMDHDESCGGIEAFVTLEEEEMSAFECDKELLAFASCNPSVMY